MIFNNWLGSRRLLQKIPFFLLLIAGGLAATLTAQTPAERQVSTPAMERDLAAAKAFITSYKNDSANILLARLTAQLTAQKSLDSPFGLRVQLLQGIAFEHDERDTTAINILLLVKERSRLQHLWATHAEACLALANLHEKMGRGNQCMANLTGARFAIAQHGLDSLYPFFAVRMASYYRLIRSDRDSAIYYAQAALRTAPGYGQPLQEAWGHMLLAFLSMETDAETAREHFSAAVPLFYQIDNHEGLGAAMSNLSNLYYSQKKYQKALTYNDSALVIIRKGVSLGDRMSPFPYLIRQLRGEIYRKLGQPDSALYYLKKGYQLQLQRESLLQSHRIIEIDARYNDEKRAQEIAAQAREIRTEKLRRNLLAGIALVVLLLASALAWFYRQLQKNNRKSAQLAEQLQNLDAAKSRFFANISHELRTPLTLVLGPLSSLLKEKSLDPKQIALLRTAARNGERLNLLINEILDLRKMEAGKMELQLQATPVGEFFRLHLAQFESLAQGKDIDFSFDIAAGTEQAAMLDREKCRQILYNLLSNAFKFTSPGGKIAVRLDLNRRNDAARLRLSVADTGRGIPPGDQAFVFDRFFQTSRPDQPAEGGTGIGLALCREYAALMGGTIVVKSRAGKGSVFRVEFPVALAAQPENPAQAQEALPGPLAFQTDEAAEQPGAPPADPARPAILVVEDNPELQAYIRLILQDKYQVTTAGNGREALGQLDAALAPDLILSDLMMPVMDGYQLLERLKSGDHTRHIPVVMLTARAEAQDRLKALRIGVDDYLTKPFEEEELLVRIENLLANSGKRRQAALEEPEPPEALPGEATVSQADRDWLESFEAYVQKNLAGGLLSIPALAHEFAMSESTLLRQLKRLTGLSPVQYLQEVRLDQARRLLESRGRDSIARIAAEVGYADARSFSRSFRQRFGKLPSDFPSH